MIRAFVLIASLLAFVSSSSSAEPFHCPQRYCLAVIDAGSSGSRLHIYAYEKDDQGWPVQLNESYSKKISPGISSLDGSNDSASQYLSELFKIEVAEPTPVLFYATAGMRMLPVDDQEKIYSQLRRWFENQPAWQLVSLKTISGKEEGIFAWLAVNYEHGNLQEDGRQQDGIMDMGGASVQIVLPVSNNTGIDDKNLARFQLYNKNYSLFVKSFLGIGQNELARQFREEDSCYALSYPLADGMKGQGNLNRCRKQVAKLLNRIHYVKKQVSPVLQNNTVKHWSVLGGLYYLAIAKPLSNNSEHFSLEEIKLKADTAVCHIDWELLHQSEPENSYLANYCLSSAYYYALVVDGYGINPRQKLQLGDSDWTLGALLYTQVPSKSI